MKSSEKSSEKLNKTQKKIIEIIREKPDCSAEFMAREIGISSRGIEKNLKILKDKKIISREGADKRGTWKIL